MPEFIFELPELQYPLRLNCAAELLDKAVASGRGEHVAIYGADSSWTYRQLQERADRIAHVLSEDLRLKPGNRVLLRGANDPMMAACWFAIVKAGFIVVATSPLLRAKELKQIIDKAQIGAALCDEALAQELLQAQADAPILRQIRYFNSLSPGSIERSMAAAPDTPFVPCDTAADDALSSRSHPELRAFPKAQCISTATCWRSVIAFLGRLCACNAKTFSAGHHL